MKEKKDALKVIQTYADREPTHTGGAERAKQLTAQLYGEGAAPAARGGALAAAGRRRIVAIVLVAAALLLAFALLLAYFWPGQREGPIYYDENSVYSEEITDIEQLRDENNLSFLYYDGNSFPSQYEVGRLVENDQIMFIIQSTLLISQTDFDAVELGICFSDDTFQDFGDFIELESVLTVENYNIQYRVESSAQNNFYAKFTVEGVVYYLNVTTAGGTEVLQGYIEQLLH